MNKAVFTIGLLVLLMSAPAFAGSVNKSVKVPAGTEATGASSVNGSVTVGADAIVSGNVKTVNGSVRVGPGATIENAATVNGSVRIDAGVRAFDVTTVNGTIKVGESVTVAGEIEAVNGKIIVATGTSVASNVGNVNGEIELSGVQIGGNVSTVSGNVDILDGTVIEGDLLVEKPGGWSWGKKRKPRIVIGPGSRIVGGIDLEREVDLYISDNASVGTVRGVMTIDDANRFSGERP